MIGEQIALMRHLEAFFVCKYPYVQQPRGFDKFDFKGLLRFKEQSYRQQNQTSFQLNGLSKIEKLDELQIVKQP